MTCPRCDRYTMSVDDAGGWRCRKCGCHVPAAQGAAVAGPARECPLPCVLPPEHEGLHRLSPPPPATEPHPYAADRSGACVCCGQRRCCHDLTVATAAKAALEVQLADTQEALANMTEERDMQQFHARDVAAERDALAAQLKAAREALTLIRDGFDCRDTPDHQSHSRHCYVCMAAVALAPPGARCHCTHEAGDSPCPIHDARSEDAMDRARAALAASGPVKAAAAPPPREGEVTSDAFPKPGGTT